jgi:hypothetical protein
MPHTPFLLPSILPKWTEHPYMQACMCCANTRAVLGTYISHNDCLSTSEPLHNVRDDARVHEQSIWELQRDALGSVLHKQPGTQ